MGRPQETGHDVNQPRIVNMRTEAIMPLRKNEHAHARHVDLGGDESCERRKAARVRAQQR